METASATVALQKKPCSSEGVTNRTQQDDEVYKELIKDSTMAFFFVHGYHPLPICYQKGRN